MRRMTVEDIHSVSLTMLRHIDEFCKVHKIMYWLSDGTLIGAVRHHGFIPWDDDVDISMPRPEYDRFIREYANSPGYKLYAPELGNSFLNYARLCEVDKTFFKQTLPWTLESPGVGIDILPLDACPENYAEYVDFAKKLVENRKRLFRLRQLYRKVAFRKDCVGFLKDFVHFVFRFFKSIGLSKRMEICLEYDIRLRSSHDLPNAKHCSHVLGVFDERKYWKTEWFKAVKRIDFCGVQLPIPVGYDERLKAEYGDYMQVPPPEKRLVHAGWQTMWWRD